MGLVGLRERVAYVGGTLTVRSARGAGTVIEARLPVPPDYARPVLNLRPARRSASDPRRNHRLS